MEHLEAGKQFVCPVHSVQRCLRYNTFLKNSYILDPQILLWKTPYHMLFSAVSSQLQHISK